MIFTNSTLIGLLETEGCFSISISINSSNYLAVQFDCTIITQKDRQLILACFGFLKTITTATIPEPRWTSGAYNISFKTFNQIDSFVKPLITAFPLLSAKWMDSQLFFEAYYVYTNQNLPRYTRLLYVVHYMFAMNWQGTTRNHSLNTFESHIKQLFPNQQAFETSRRTVLADLNRILNKSYPSLQKNPLNIEEYFIGLFIGDGTAFVTFNFRKDRKPNLYREFSLSLKSHPRNALVLQEIARLLGFTWLFVTSDKTRCRVKITDSQTIENIIQPLLLKYKYLLPTFKRKQLVAYQKCEEIRQSLKKAILTKADKQKIKSNLTYIYYCSQGGRYRKLTLEIVLKTFNVY